jgi:hypothetical protein
MIWPFNKTNITQESYWPLIWKLVPVIDVMGMLDMDEALNVALLKKGCEMLKIPYVGGGTYFFNKSTSEKEIEYLKKNLAKELNPKNEYVIAYSKDLKPHPNLVFYKVIAIKGNDILDLKKALKIHKLKAFL